MIDAQNQDESLLDAAPRLPALEPALTPGDLPRIRRHLEAQRAELVAGIARLEAQAAEAPTRRAPGSQASAPDNATPLAILRGERDKTLGALERLERGTYGVCLECGHPIAPRRLAVIPTAERCDECAWLASSALAAH